MRTHGATLKEIGRELGVSPERVRQILTRALHKLRRSGLHVFRDWLDSKGVDNDKPANFGRENSNGHRWRRPAPGAK